MPSKSVPPSYKKEGETRPSLPLRCCECRGNEGALRAGPKSNPAVSIRESRHERVSEYVSAMAAAPAAAAGETGPARLFTTTTCARRGGAGSGSAESGPSAKVAPVDDHRLLPPPAELLPPPPTPWGRRSRSSTGDDAVPPPSAPARPPPIIPKQGGLRNPWCGGHPLRSAPRGPPPAVAAETERWWAVPSPCACGPGGPGGPGRGEALPLAGVAQPPQRAWASRTRSHMESGVEESYRSPVG